MGLDDNISNFRGREQLWATLCAFDGMEYNDEVYTVNQADELIESIWDFVEQTCEEEGVKVPSKIAAITELKTLILETNNG